MLADASFIGTEEQMIIEVAATARASMQRILQQNDIERYSRSLAQTLRHPHNRAKFATLFMTLSSSGINPVKPKHLNYQLSQWLGDNKADADKPPRYLPYPEDVTRVAQSLVSINILENSRQKPNKRWGRPEKHQTDSENENGGRPSYYSKTTRMRDLETLFAKAESRQLLQLLLNYDLTLYRFIKFTLSVLMRLMRDKTDPVPAIERIVMGSSWCGPRFPAVELDRSQMDCTAACWAVSLVPQLINEPFFLFGLLDASVKC